MRTSRLLFAMIFFLGVLGDGWAHSSGHGGKLEGVGPNGGKLAPIVSAKDADLGEKARTRGIAEWTEKNGTIEIHLWDPSLKKQILVTPKADLKWILIGIELGDPRVTKQPATKTAKFRYDFDPALLAKAKTVEVIIPGLDSSDEKYVFAMNLKP